MTILSPIDAVRGAEKRPAPNEHTVAFAEKIGCAKASPAMLQAFEDIRQSGIRRARAAHFERVKIIQQYKAEPGMFFAAIKPNLSTEEMITDARHIRFTFRNLPTWQQETRRSQMQRAALMEIYARFFRRFGRRIWIEEAA
jgi:hypothetical protein